MLHIDRQNLDADSDYQSKIQNPKWYELDVVTLTHDVAEYHLKKGDRGTVVHCYGDGKAYEVEFIDDDIRTTALLKLTDADIRVEIPTSYPVPS